MKHPFEILKPEYSQLLAAMAVRDECRHLVDEVAVKLIGYRTRYQPVSDKTGIPVVFVAASFEREASSDFNLSPAQGDPWRKISRHVPANRGPFRSWLDAAIDAYHINGLDQVGADNWTWELICYYGELFNGFGYRDFHHEHSPYLWGGTNIQQLGKYTMDHGFDPSVKDKQLGIIPIAKRMIDIEPALALPFVIAPPLHSGIAASDAGADTKWVQDSLNKLGWQPPLDVDGSYGGLTKRAVEHFQQAFGLKVDFAGPETVKALQAALAAIEEVVKEPPQ